MLKGQENPAVFSRRIFCWGKGGEMGSDLNDLLDDMYDMDFEISGGDGEFS